MVLTKEAGGGEIATFHNTLKPADRPLKCTLAVLLLAGCGEDVTCPQGVFAAISVHALSAADATPLLGARGVVSDGTYRDSLLEIGEGYYEGAAGRAGLYAVRLELAGYAAWDTAGVLVQSTPGPCAMVETERLEARLLAAE